MIFEFEDCVLDTATQELRRAGELVHVEPQVLAGAHGGTGSTRLGP